MRMVDLITKKRDGGTLTAAEIDWLVAAYVAGTVPDYQMSAYLMAVFFKDMTDAEMAAYANALLHSGTIIDMSDVDGKAVDKHSTGGVGDKISLPLLAVLSALGINVPMVSGRGLGHTGGTLDKFEAIPGFNVNLSPAEFHAQVQKHHVAITAAGPEVAPADKMLYALRDVTGTVESIPLIAGSIMSKKISSGISGLVLDVKVGNGAFMKTEAEATRLAEAMIAIGKANGVQTEAVLTNMNQPLGITIGNALEVFETIAILNGRGAKDVRDLTVTLAARMIVMAGKTESYEFAANLAGDVLRDGRAKRAFKQLIADQGGNPAVVDNPRLLPRAPYRIQVQATRAGFVTAIDTHALGIVGMHLGGGRSKVTDTLDYAVGLVMHKKMGTPVSVGDMLATLHSNTETADSSVESVRQAFTIGPEKLDAEPLVYRILQ